MALVVLALVFLIFGVVSIFFAPQLPAEDIADSFDEDDEDFFDEDDEDFFDEDESNDWIP